ncbi:TPA: hypothetical protein DEP58_03490 [Patescibacteria group bacterium]|nr:MAG: hypothetical protein UU98_C0013G0033 [Parcubacteria group bacterium GW2011_GWD2_42_14]HCC05343.1 hypothetical protein [Patescibacteria group bacterium]
MNPKTFLVDFMPTINKETVSQLRKKEYADELLKTYDLGEVVFCTLSECKERGIVEKPDLIICCYEVYAREIKDVIPEAVLYVAESVNSVFYRKAETEEKIEKNRKIFKEAAETLQHLREATPKEREEIRKFHALSYGELYKIIQKAFISDDEDLRKKAWDLLWGPGEKNSNIVWMRVQMMAEVWENSKGEILEKLMLMSMERHIDFGLARKIENYTDERGQEYHQYVYIDPFGNDMEFIRKLPCASKNQERFSYEALLERNEVPKNYLRVQMEANQFKEQCDEYREAECEKVRKVLEEYKKDPSKSRKELGVATHGNNKDGDSLSQGELDTLRNFLEKYKPKT